MLILCPGTKTIYNSDRITRYYVDELDEEDGGGWAIVGGCDDCAYALGYYDSEDEANEAMINMMEQIRRDCRFVMIDAK